MPIPITYGPGMNCATAESLAVYLKGLVRSGKRFRVELGSALVFFDREGE